MPHSPHLDLFREAVRKERSDDALRARRCDGFLEQIIRYRNGDGTLPDEQQFLLWREDLKKTTALRALKAAMNLPEADDSARDITAPAAWATLAPDRQRSKGGMDSSAA